MGTEVAIAKVVALVVIFEMSTCDEKTGMHCMGMCVKPELSDTVIF